MALILLLLPAGGCATVRVTDPSRTATEQFLLSGAASEAVNQLSTDQLAVPLLRDRLVFMDLTYFQSTTPEHPFMLGELRAKLLLAGVRLTSNREKADIVLEVRSGGLGIDRYEYLLGVPAFYVPQVGSATEVPLTTPELAIVKTIRQRGFASVSYVAYWNDTGEIVGQSGPFIGRTFRDDLWFFGFGPRTDGDIPTVVPMEE